MRAPDLGSHVVVLEHPREKELRDRRVWTVWSQSPTGWWIFRKPEGGGLRRMGRPARTAPRARTRGGR